MKVVCVNMLGRRDESSALGRRGGFSGKRRNENKAQETHKTQRQINDHLKRTVQATHCPRKPALERGGEVMNVVYALDVVSMQKCMYQVRCMRNECAFLQGMLWSA